MHLTGLGVLAAVPLLTLGCSMTLWIHQWGCCVENENFMLAVKISNGAVLLTGLGLLSARKLHTAQNHRQGCPG